MIRVDGVRKAYGAVTAEEDVSFLAADGRVTGLLGPNGAGKTTVMRMITGIARPDHGRVEIDGREVAADPLHAAARLGSLPDSPGLYPRLTAREAPDATRRMFQTHRIEVPFTAYDDRVWVRISAQVYNRPEDYERLAEALRGF